MKIISILEKSRAPSRNVSCKGLGCETLASADSLGENLQPPQAGDVFVRHFAEIFPAVLLVVELAHVLGVVVAFRGDDLLATHLDGFRPLVVFVPLVDVVVDSVVVFSDHASEARLLVEVFAIEVGLDLVQAHRSYSLQRLTSAVLYRQGQRVNSDDVFYSIAYLHL